MTRWFLIGSQHYSENTPEYGYGDCPDRINYLAAVVEADTLRKAQNAVKKIRPNVRFGGMFSPLLVTANDPFLAYIIGPYDRRLSDKAKAAHCEVIDTICNDTIEYLDVLAASSGREQEQQAAKQAVLARLGNDR